MLTIAARSGVISAPGSSARTASPLPSRKGISRRIRRIGTLRGFHYQTRPQQEAKTLSCLSGAIYDIVVDLRPTSPTFMQWIAVEFSAQDRRSLHVPAGCANAWMTTAPDTVVHYYMSEFYGPAAARGLRHDDPTFAFRWPATPTVISEKDRTYPDFDPRSLDL